MYVLTFNEAFPLLSDFYRRCLMRVCGKPLKFGIFGGQAPSVVAIVILFMGTSFHCQIELSKILAVRLDTC